MADVYRTFSGFVKFEPREGEAGGKNIRSIVIRQGGIKEQAIDVRATLWPSHDDVDVEQGDFVVMEGKFTVNKGEKDGEPVTYFNLSVSSILNLGQGNSGTRVDVAEAEGGDGDDGIPY